MPCATNCPCTPDQVDLAFRESEQWIDREVKDRSYKLRRYLVDYAPVKTFPDGVGYTLSKVRFFGDIGPQYDGFDGWRKEQRSRPFASGHTDAHDECGYVWEEVGHGFEELHFHLMNRDLKTIPICIKDIRTFWEFKQFQNLIFQNLAEISANMKEQLVRNAMIGFAVKHVITSAGLEVSSSNPYELPNITGVVVGRLNFRVLKRIYGPLKREAGAWGLDTSEGRPMFGLMASEDVLDDMFYEDPEIRQDLRWGSEVDSLIKRMNFVDTVRGMYIVIPDDFAPRYRDDGAGNLIRVFPYERAVTIQSGTRPAPNPDYELAEYELALILTRDMFGLRTRNSLSSAGGQTDFEAESGMFEWKWHNPPRYCDPNRRVGYYFANGNIGIEPGDFTDCIGLLVRRRPPTLDASFWPAATCPEDDVDCDNQLAVQGCPCQQIIACFPLLSDPNSLQFVLSRGLPAGTVVTDAVSVDLSNGGIATGTISEINADLDKITVDFGEPVECNPALYVQVSCAAPIECTQPVISQFCTDDTHVILKLRDLLVVTSAAGTPTLNAITTLGNVIDVVLTAVDLDQITYSVTLAAALADGECIKALCVPTAVNADCPSCDPDPIVCDDETGLP